MFENEVKVYQIVKNHHESVDSFHLRVANEIKCMDAKIVKCRITDMLATFHYQNRIR